MRTKSLSDLKMVKSNISKMLEDYSYKNPARFHMPGHKGTLNKNDITEISVTDNLNSPSSYILEAQQELSKYYNSFKSYFLVNGATLGIQTIIKYASIMGKKKILFGRNSHKTVINSCMAFGIDAIIVEDKFDDQLQVFRFNEKAYIDTISKHINEIGAVLLTSVDYFGRVISLDSIKKVCNDNNIMLLIDEAHGSHLSASNLLPTSLLTKADMCVHSPHKTLSAYTQGAYLHISSKVNPDILEYVLQSLQTSSPNSLLVESLDNARSYLVNNTDTWDNTYYRAKELENKINSIKNISVIGLEFVKATGYSNKDTTRLVIDVSQIGSGIYIAKELEDNYNIFMEMATFKYVIAILTPWDKQEWYDILCEALKNISQSKNPIKYIPKTPKKNKVFYLKSNVLNSSLEQVPIAVSAGKISAMPIGIYPPGVALILPGERISKDIVDYLLLTEKLGGVLFGIYNRNIYCVSD